MASVVDQELWDELNERAPLRYDEDSLNFRDLFERYLTPGGSCFEVGCYPGRFLIYLCKRFGYTANGIDATPFVQTRMQPFLLEHGVRVGQLHCGDFLTFRHGETYDVVCSFGFVEHFEDVEAVIEKHAALVRDNGTLVIACPNFRGAQYVFHRVFDAENLRRHVVQTMDLGRWRRALERSGMTIVHDGYYRTVDFWMHPDHANGWRGRVGGAMGRIVKQIDPHIKFPNRWLSPYLVSVSRKVDATGTPPR